MFSILRHGASDNERLVLGRTGRYGFFPKFHISGPVRHLHMYVTGLTGRGKSKLLQNLIVQDVLAGRGCSVVDPHGDLVKDVLRVLVASRSQSWLLDHLIYVAPWRRDYVVPFNVLARSSPEVETYEVAQRVISAFMRTWARTLQEPPRFQQIMRSALAVLVERGETLCSLYKLLTDDGYRNQQLEKISDPKVSMDCRAFFTNEFDRWGRERAPMMSSTTNKISALTDNPSLFYMLGQKENGLDIRRIMDEGKVLLVDLGGCDDETKRLFGSLIVTGFEQAALSRARAPHAARTAHFVYVDEFQDFAVHPGAAETFSQMLSQVRKFGLHMILANQSIAQLDVGLQTALGNAQTIVTFRISRADAEALARVLGEVNTQAVKHDSQFAAQHPVFSPLSEQWEQFVQFLTKQAVRQATVKTADDRLAVIWSERVKDGDSSDQQLEDFIVQCLQRHGRPFADVFRELVPAAESHTETPIFSR